MVKERGRVCLDDDIYSQLVQQFNLNPVLDVFADQTTTKCLYFCEDAFASSWDGCDILFNPPFHKMEEALDKLMISQCQAIVVCPYWTNAKWWSNLGDSRFELNRPMYRSIYREIGGRRLPFLQWPTTTGAWFNSKC
jgi:hypothetical protein